MWDTQKLITCILPSFTVRPVLWGLNRRAHKWVFAWGSCRRKVIQTLYLCFRILSLACSPSGASFVCSAAAQSPVSHMDFTVINSGGKSMNQVPGKLLLWDTKTMKQQVLAGFLYFLSLLVENECLLFQYVGTPFLNYADFLFNTLLFPPSSFPLCHIQDINK